MQAKRLLKFLRYPRRFSRGRGFGVHSPFAFRFVREVLTQPYAYYCYPQLRIVSSDCNRSSDAICCLFRVALVSEGRIELTDEPDKAIRAALTAARASNGPSPYKVALSPGNRRKLASGWVSREYGMLFEAPDISVWVDYDRLPHQRFRIV